MNEIRKTEIDKENIPIVTIVLVVFISLLGLRQLSIGMSSLWDKYAMYQGAIGNNEAYRLITCAFLHADQDHLMHNMITLGIFGYCLENQIGRIRFALLYIAGLLGSSLLINFAGGYGAHHAGASGAIYAVVSATIIIQCVGNRQYFYIIFYVLYDVYYNISSNVSWQGHLGGAIVGIIFAIIFLLMHVNNDKSKKLFNKNKLKNNKYSSDDNVYY